MQNWPFSVFIISQGLCGYWVSLVAPLVQAPHQRLPHPRHRLHVVAHLLQLVQHHSGRVVHDVLWAATGTNTQRDSTFPPPPPYVGCLRFSAWALTEKQNAFNCSGAFSLPSTPWFASRQHLNPTANDNTSPRSVFHQHPRPSPFFFFWNLQSSGLPLSCDLISALWSMCTSYPPKCWRKHRIFINVEIECRCDDRDVTPGHGLSWIADCWDAAVDSFAVCEGFVSSNQIGVSTSSSAFSSQTNSDSFASVSLFRGKWWIDKLWLLPFALPFSILTNCFPARSF